jgi:hyperosmotically inducible protein
MSNNLKLKVAAYLVCGVMANNLIAAGNSNSSTPAIPASATTTTTTTTPGPNDDAKLTTLVNSSLKDYAGKVMVTVTAGVVYLTGQLPSDTDYEKVITLTESVKGVSDVNVDKLTVKDSSSPLHDTYITAKAKGALIQADLMGADIPSWTVTVETKDGQVFLSGNMATEQEKQKVIETVKKVKGVIKVNDKITVGKGTPAAGTTAPSTSPDTNANSNADEDDAAASDDSADDDADDESDEDSDSDNSEDASPSNSSKSSN